jgi:hypothetical protein
MELLLKRGANPNQRSTMCRRTALMEAAYWGCLDAAKLLLTVPGVSVDAADIVRTVAAAVVRGV